MPEDFDQLIRQGFQARAEQRPGDARRHFMEAVELCRMGDSLPGLVKALKGLGQVERDNKQTEAALQHYQEATEICRKTGDAAGLAHTIRHVGDILRNQGRLELAEPCYREALALHRSLPETSSLDMANAIRGLALLSCAANDTPLESKKLWTEAAALYSKCDVEAGVEECRRQLERLS